MSPITFLLRLERTDVMITPRKQHDNDETEVRIIQNPTLFQRNLRLSRCRYYLRQRYSTISSPKNNAYTVNLQLRSRHFRHGYRLDYARTLMGELSSQILIDIKAFGYLSRYLFCISLQRCQVFWPLHTSLRIIDTWISFFTEFLCNFATSAQLSKNLPSVR
jgi:hypothetical protein